MILPSTQLTRRNLLGRCAGAVATATALGEIVPNVSMADPPEFPPGRFVDIHTHIGKVWTVTQELTVDVLLSWMDGNDIAQAVVLPLVSPESSSFPITSEFVLDATKAHRDRLIPFCCVDPRASYGGGVKVMIDLLRRYVDAGAKGFGEHKPGVKIDDPLNMTLYAACAELKLPVLFHLDNVRNTDAPGLPGLENVLKQFPDLPLIGHGPGWWASISGDATVADLAGKNESAVTPGGAIDVLMDRYPNLYGDLSAGSGASALMRDMKFAREFILRWADRLMFGTDFLSPGQEVPQFIVLRQLNLPSEVQAKVFRDNARRLLLTN